MEDEIKKKLKEAFSDAKGIIFTYNDIAVVLMAIKIYEEREKNN